MADWRPGEEREWREGVARRRLPPPAPDTVLGLPDHPTPILRFRGPTRTKTPEILMLTASVTVTEAPAVEWGTWQPWAEKQPPCPSGWCKEDFKAEVQGD